MTPATSTSAPRTRSAARAEPRAPIQPVGNTRSSSALVLVGKFRCRPGQRGLRESRYQAEDPLVLRVLGPRRASRCHDDLAAAGLPLRSVEQAEALGTELVLDRLTALPAGRVTLDFDGSVIGTKRRAEASRSASKEKTRGPAQRLPLALHRRPERPGARRSSPLRQRARLARCPRLSRCLHRAGSCGSPGATGDRGPLDSAPSTPMRFSPSSGSAACPTPSACRSSAHVCASPAHRVHRRHHRARQAARRRHRSRAG